MKKIIQTENAPQAIGPYSQAVQVDKLLLMSGQIALDPKSMQIILGGAAEQTHQVIKNIQAVLKAAGADLSHVVKTVIYLKDMEDFETVNKVYGEYFAQEAPARSTIQAARLPKDVWVEIEAIAHLS